MICDTSETWNHPDALYCSASMKTCGAIALAVLPSGILAQLMTWIWIPGQSVTLKKTVY